MSSVNPWLPYDYSRCNGDTGNSKCVNCLRKLSPGHEFWQSFFTESPMKDNVCKYYIPFKEVSDV